MLAARRKVAVVHEASPQAANDNLSGTITPDDILVLVVLVAMFVGTVGLLIYTMMSGTDDVVSMLKR